jgi:ubiquinone/menaquinone biosynthesis C-methylase UbiE
MSIQQYLKIIRAEEIRKILPFIKSGSAVLEIGAGAGWQAKIIADSGCQVSAIDISVDYLGYEKVWNVIEYDGMHIPFRNACFDVVFSSNVLEHIAHVESFQVEIMRVLKPGGIAIHILPTGIWRLWTNLTYYPFLIHELLMRVSASLVKSEGVPWDGSTLHHSWLKKVRRLVIAPRHGEQGNALTEMYTFSRFRWSRLFRATGWKIVNHFPNHIFYTGYASIGPAFSITVRRRLSYLLGSACDVYILEKNDNKLEI